MCYTLQFGHKNYRPNTSYYPKEIQAELYTIGYAADHFDNFLSRVRELNPTHLVDVRTYAYSNYQEDFRGKEFSDRVNASGLKYVYLGDKVGGKPKDESVYSDGHVDYCKLEQASFFQTGIRQLMQAAEKPTTKLMLMCGCGRPEKCHRGLIVCDILFELGANVIHALPDRTTCTQLDVRRLLGKDQAQLF